MKTKPKKKERLKLPTAELNVESLSASEKSNLSISEPTRLRMRGHRHESLREHSLVEWCLGTASLPLSTEIRNSRYPGSEHPGVFFESDLVSLLSGRPAPESSRRKTVHDESNDPYHDSDREDVYDLYNACNGVLLGGLLDIRKLDELSKEELEALDVARLREIWDHTASGCSRCESIISTLNRARRTLRDKEIR
jgi:hypothetical protein